MARRIQAQEKFLDLRFPEKGIDVSTGYGMQQPGTTPMALNVRAFEPLTNRARGGTRPSLAYNPSTLRPVAGPVLDLATLVGVGYADPAGGSASGSVGRIVNLVAAGANEFATTGVYVSSPGTNWTAANSGGGSLNSSGTIRSASLNQTLWYCDGTNYAYYDPSVNTLYPWTAALGSLPLSGSDAARLIEVWRGRIVLAGVRSDPQNFFMSRVGDPTDWDYFPEEPSPDQPIAGNLSQMGEVGDIITGLVPLSDDVLLVGTDHTIYQFSGDPMAGGQIDLVTDAIGMAWGRAWCKGPDGTVYFFASKPGVYAIKPGEKPVKISQQIDGLLRSVNLATYDVRLAWDETQQGLHVFISTANSPSTCLSPGHYFFESRTGGWFKDTYLSSDGGATGLGFTAVCVFDGPAASDRAVVCSIQSGFTMSPTGTSGNDISANAVHSEVWLGPILSTEMDDFLLKDLQAILGENSGSVTFGVYAGNTAEKAYASTALLTGTWAASRNLLTPVRRSGHAVYVKISGSAAWQLEHIRARIAGRGKVRRRGW